jgi:hypothetical protein
MIHLMHWDGTYLEKFREGVFKYEIKGKIKGEDFANKGEITSIPVFSDNNHYKIKNCITCTFPDQLYPLNSNLRTYCEECANMDLDCPECDYVNEANSLNEGNEAHFFIGYTSENNNYCK